MHLNERGNTARLIIIPLYEDNHLLAAAVLTVLTANKKKRNWR